LVAAVNGRRDNAGRGRYLVEQNGALTGFSIDLWNNIAERMNVTTDYQVAADVHALLEAVRSGKADLGISAISITSEREAIFDFSQPILTAGLQVLVTGSSVQLTDTAGKRLEILRAAVLRGKLPRPRHER
jgi:ABC-type amino acid transport substrate-binding protein